MFCLIHIWSSYFQTSTQKDQIKPPNSKLSVKTWVELLNTLDPHHRLSARSGWSDARISQLTDGRESHPSNDTGHLHTSLPVPWPGHKTPLPSTGHQTQHPRPAALYRWDSHLTPLQFVVRWFLKLHVIKKHHLLWLSSSAASHVNHRGSFDLLVSNVLQPEVKSLMKLDGILIWTNLSEEKSMKTILKCCMRTNVFFKISLLTRGNWWIYSDQVTTVDVNVWSLMDFLFSTKQI